MSYIISSLNDGFVESRSHVLDLYKSLSVLDCDNKFDHGVTITSNGSIHFNCGFATSFGSFGERYASEVDISNENFCKFILCFNGGIDDVPKVLSEIFEELDIQNSYYRGLKHCIYKNIVYKNGFEVLTNTSCKTFIKKLLSDRSSFDMRLAYVKALLTFRDGVCTCLSCGMGRSIYDMSWKIFNSFIATLKFNFPYDAIFLDAFAEEVEDDGYSIVKIVKYYDKYSAHIDDFICKIYSLLFVERFHVMVDKIECILWYEPRIIEFIDNLKLSALSALPYKRLLTKSSYTIENLISLHGFDVMWNMDNIYMVRVA